MNSRWLGGFKAPDRHLAIISLCMFVLCVISRVCGDFDSGKEASLTSLPNSRRLNAPQPGVVGVLPKLPLYHEGYIPIPMTSTSAITSSTTSMTSTTTTITPSSTALSWISYAVAKSTSIPDNSVDSFQPFDDQVTRTMDKIEKPFLRAQTQLKNSMKNAGEIIAKPEVYGPAIAGGTITAGAITAAVIQNALKHQTATFTSTSTTSSVVEQPRRSMRMAMRMRYSANMKWTSTTVATVVSKEEVSAISQSTQMLELSGFWIGVGYCSSLMLVGLLSWKCCPRKETRRIVEHADQSDDSSESEDDEEDDEDDDDDEEELYPLE